MMARPVDSLRQVQTTPGNENRYDGETKFRKRVCPYGVDNLRVADGSIMPRVTTGNTMAPCVIIGERAGEMLKAEHGL